jgi:lambda family phage portal protein
MTLLDRLAARLGYSKSARRPTYVRGFDGAKTDNISLGFKPANNAIDQELVGSLDMLRGRSRTLAQNNDHAKKFLRMVKTNVVGPEGFKLQALAADNGKADAFARNVIEQAWAEWGRKGVCEVSGLLSWTDVQRLVIETVARDGEALIRMVRGGGRFALQVLDIDRLATYLNGTGAEGRIVMGVELNGVGRPVAYHLHESHPNGNFANPSSRVIRVPAGDVLHVYTSERPEQHRGIPWMHTAMLRLENLGKFERAALTAARKGAQSLGFFQSPDGEPPPGEEKDADGNQIHTSVEGEFDTLPPGYQFQQFDSKYPSDIYGSFVKDCLRSISSGLGVAYNGLANDLENVNFSSIRAGVLEERDVWMTLQTWMAEHVLTPIFREWLTVALLSGQLGTLPPLKFEKFAAHRWQPRRWAWVDPRADMEAKLMAIRAGLDTRRDVAAEQGKDFDDVVEQLKLENELLASLGVESDLGGAKPANSSP